MSENESSENEGTVTHAGMTRHGWIRIVGPIPAPPDPGNRADRRRARRAAEAIANAAALAEGDAS